ncbi:hypothetical protein FCV25MIE_05207 [Fagus crenata]
MLTEILPADGTVKDSLTIISSIEEIAFDVVLVGDATAVMEEKEEIGIEEVVCDGEAGVVDSADGVGDSADGVGDSVDGGEDSAEIGLGEGVLSSTIGTVGDGIVTRDGEEVMDSVCVERFWTEQGCSMTNSQGEESKVDVTGVLHKAD